jgi:transcriptional regulator with PAS, ATPase and Fis domain
MLHRISPRAGGPFIAVNCAAIPETLIEAELFGVEKGAFTGATHSRPGRFERAHDGTLFLDEVASLNLAVQGKLLRALQQREIERVGDVETRKVDVRVVAAANVDLESEVRAGRFRADLFYRLNTFPIELPPLRDRRDDIPLLLNHLLGKFTVRHNRPDIPGLTEHAIEALLNYDYPGNIRELENILERAVILASAGSPIDLQHLSISGGALRQKSFVIDRDGKLCLPQCDEPGNTASMLSALGRTVLDGGVRWEEVSAAVAREAVARCAGNLAKAARMLGISRAQLSYRLRKKWRRLEAEAPTSSRKRPPRQRRP